MTENDKLKKSYQKMIDWNLYRLEQNNQSLDKLLKLLPKLDRSLEADPIYQKDVVDLDSLKIIYETGIRGFESQIERYEKLLKEI